MYNDELSDKEELDCLKEDCSGKLQDFDPIKVRLPTPGSEVRYGGKSPKYSTQVELPFKYCNKCRQVFHPPEE